VISKGADTLRGRRSLSDSVEILAIIPARGGSKGLPGKNLRHLAGRPLIAYAIDAALASSFKPRIVVSTDSEEIASAARELGAEVPFMRPAELAGDETPMFPVIRHALEWLARNEGYEPELVVLLQPTSPLRTAQHIDGAIRVALEPGSDSVVSLCEAEHSPYWMRVLDEDGLVKPFVESEGEYARRQDLPPVYRLNGAILVTRPGVAKEGQLLGPKTRAFVMSREDSVDIDDETGFLLAEALLRLRGGGEA
jgi:N-acylneuraminate cytidylyltransferase/CMP-N,N'-diacetyllegionaminic acid synthase